MSAPESYELDATVACPVFCSFCEWFLLPLLIHNTAPVFPEPFGLESTLGSFLSSFLLSYQPGSSLRIHYQLAHHNIICLDRFLGSFAWIICLDRLLGSFALPEGIISTCMIFRVTLGGHTSVPDDSSEMTHLGLQELTGSSSLRMDSRVEARGYMMGRTMPIGKAI